MSIWMHIGTAPENSHDPASRDAHEAGGARAAKAVPIRGTGPKQLHPRARVRERKRIMSEATKAPRVREAMSKRVFVKRAMSMLDRLPAGQSKGALSALTAMYEDEPATQLSLNGTIAPMPAPTAVKAEATPPKARA